MKKYKMEIIMLLLQLFMFYIFPIFAGPTDVIAMVLLIIVATWLLALILGCISDKRMKFLYPPIIAVLFVPSVFIYYNESALVHAVWYFVIASVGLLIGTLVRAVACKIISKGEKL